MIHKFRIHNRNIVLDVNSGAIHVMDDISYELLCAMEGRLPDAFGMPDDAIADEFAGKFGRTDVMEAFGELKKLYSDGMLFSDDIYEEHIREHMAISKDIPVIKALCLHIAHDCNLRCGYCFASTGNFGSKRSLMPLETAKNAIDFLIEKSGSRRNLEVDFFGGEPLLNFETVKQTVLYARERQKETGKNFRFTLTTNAVLLNDEYKEFINKNMENVVLSIDGRPETNDRMRRRADGGGTYRDILPKIKEMADSRDQDNYYVRGTFTRKNLDFSKDVLHLANLGFKQISVEPVVAAMNTELDIRDEDLPALFDEYENLALEYVKRRKASEGFNFFHFMLDTDQGPCAVKRAKGCGSGVEYLAVTPEGDLYPCHQFVGVKEFKMGNVNNGSHIDQDIRNMFASRNIYSVPECVKCWAKFFCSGGCAANDWHYNGCIDRPYGIGCELERKRVECAIWAKAAESDVSS
jgi:uncharacterized protein